MIRIVTAYSGAEVEARPPTVSFEQVGDDRVIVSIPLSAPGSYLEFHDSTMVLEEFFSSAAEALDRILGEQALRRWGARRV